MTTLQARAIRVFVVAAVRLYREGLTNVLGNTNGLTVVGAEPDRRKALSRIIDLTPEVVLLDMTVPQSHALVSELGENGLNIPVVALGVDGAEATMVACAEAGITGYLTHSASLDELVHVVKAASRGEAICSPQLAGALVRRLAALAARHRPPDVAELRFTRREREIARLLERDLTNKEIATHLGIEVATVKNHVHNLLDKLSVHRRDEAARLLVGRRQATGMSDLYVAADHQ
jgi:two-component system nitrate/nitrite response regulator NarL